MRVLAVVVALFVTGCAGSRTPPESLAAGPSQPVGVARCAYDRSKMLALDQAAFDQDLAGGWRELAQRDGCTADAAQLINVYREANAPGSGILYWHEGQLRAQLGETEVASALFEKSRRENDAFGWNHYVDASVAFLKGDRASLEAARYALAKLPRPTGFDPRGPDGKPIKIAWPPNLNVVDGLLQCFGTSYAEAYGPTCTRPITVD